MLILSYESHILRVCDVWSPRRRGELVAALPEESLLAESDASGEFEARVADATQLIADARGWSLDVAEERLAWNARAFLL